MGKRNTKWSYQTYLRFLRNGRGTGDLAEYKPWITIHDFPSKGKVVRILGKKTHRIHHLLSQLEKIYFLMVDNDPSVEDIKEQFPLPLEITQLIAAEKHIRHPLVNGFSYVMTTDFMIKQNGSWHAVQIKTKADSEKERVKEKFEIEKTYYRSIHTEWKVMTEKDLPALVAENYYWLNSGIPFESLVPDPTKRSRMKAAFLELYANYSIPFHTILEAMDEMCGVSGGTTMQLFKSCIMDNTVAINTLETICLEEPRRMDAHAMRCFG